MAFQWLLQLCWLLRLLHLSSASNFARSTFAPIRALGVVSPAQHVLDDSTTLTDPIHDDKLPLSLSVSRSQDRPLVELRDALEVMQSSWFQVWLGAWPTAIDWTAAVLHTHLAASLRTLSRHVSMTAALVENELNAYFAQSIAYYFGEDVFAIRNEAYDDMLWVVLGWLQANRFIQYHTHLHYTEPMPWHGSQFVDAFAHRSRTFYALARQGYDTDLCDGGMVWNPRLEPYKNAITNQLYISASVGMYLYFTGDNNDSPFVGLDASGSNFSQPHDPHFLAAAVEAYEWLKNVNMTNEQGLYVDGYHISGWRRNRPKKGLKCDARNEEVYTYNQAVILSGLRDLWESTGNTTYLEDGHHLIRSAIVATGWSLESRHPSYSRKWSGLGRNGTLEETCDASATCSRDTQSFKGIYFHHLTSFCEPLPTLPLIPGISHGASLELAALHRHSCRNYRYWVEHNARAALGTRSATGRFGMWWGATAHVVQSPRAEGGQDYRNDPTILARPPWQLEGARWATSDSSQQTIEPGRVDAKSRKDLNDRGRGRTVETQGGGVSVVRAWLEFSRWE